MKKQAVFKFHPFSKKQRKVLNWWTEDPYDHYNEWLSETYDALKKAGR